GKGQLFSSIPEEYRWNVAFGLAGVVMTISLLVFVFTQKSLGPIGLSPFQPREVQDANGNITYVVNKNKRLYEILVYLGTLAIIPVIMTMISKTEYTAWFMYIIGPA